MICFVPTRMQAAIQHAATHRWLNCNPPKFCVGSMDAERTALVGGSPVVAHLQNVRVADLAIWIRNHCTHQPFVLLVPDDACPLEYFEQQQLTQNTLVMRECDMKLPSRWKQLEERLLQIGPVREVRDRLKQYVVAAIDTPGATHTILQLIDNADRFERVQEIESLVLRKSRGTLSRGFKQHGIAPPQVLLHVVRCALLRGLIEAGVSFEQTCTLMHVDPTSMRRKFGRTYGGTLDQLAATPLTTVFEWCAAFVRTDQRITQCAAEAFKQLTPVSQIGRRIA